MVVRARRIILQPVRSVAPQLMQKMCPAALVEYVGAPRYKCKISLAQHGLLSEAPQNELALLFDRVCGLLFGESKVG